MARPPRAPVAMTAGMIGALREFAGRVDSAASMRAAGKQDGSKCTRASQAARVCRHRRSSRHGNPSLIAARQPRPGNLQEGLTKTVSALGDRRDLLCFHTMLLRCCLSQDKHITSQRAAIAYARSTSDSSNRVRGLPR